ncbi:MAG: response regulator [Armatimonadetes bacterium]|nr:response regulator [Armatimonadota bacterium]
MKILVVDDEARFRKYLSRLLGSRRHEVRTAASGAEAIESGLRYHPEVLVTDWLLKERLHGIHVSQALQSVDGDLRTILVTGYPSHDLQSDARRAGVFRMIEKPFEAEELLGALEEARVAASHHREPEMFGAIEIDTEGQILFQNARARAMLGKTEAGHDPGLLERVFAGSSYRALDESCVRWARVMPRSRPQRTWWIRCRTWEDCSRIFLLLDEEDDPGEVAGLAGLLTGSFETAQEVRWPFRSHVLVLEDNQLVRKINLKQLEASSCPCCSADSEELALKLFCADPEIHVVLLDFTAGVDLAALVEHLRGLRRGVRVVGNSAHARRRDFHEIGVDLFLPKPWRVSDLIELLGS